VQIKSDYATISALNRGVSMVTIDAELTKTAITVAASVATTLITLCKWFYSTLTSLNEKITILSSTIAQLDKNLAVQAAIFESHMVMHDKCNSKKGG